MLPSARIPPAHDVEAAALLMEFARADRPDRWDIDNELSRKSFTPDTSLSHSNQKEHVVNIPNLDCEILAIRCLFNGDCGSQGGKVLHFFNVRFWAPIDS
jgi:hypothetical protein